jgi:histidine triad (HIT) family protein
MIAIRTRFSLKLNRPDQPVIQGREVVFLDVFPREKETVSQDQSCLFCKIVDRKIPAKLVHSDEMAIAFEDINPQAPTHILIVPNKHITDIQRMNEGDQELIGHLFFVARNVAEKRGLDIRGYRLVINNGQDAGQAVFHIHLHLLSGRAFAWPPG